MRTISETTGCFIEIVNFNIRNMQYVCAGELQALDVLKGVLDTIASQNKIGMSHPGEVERAAGFSS